MKKTPFLIVILLLAAPTAVCANSFNCPTPEEGLTFTGPDFKTNIYGRSQVQCRYYMRERKKGTIEVFFYRDYNRQRACNSPVYTDADLRSWEYQIYAFTKDEDPRDFLTKTYWDELAAELMEQAELWALPCGTKHR
ncbi:MAG: hypothetical protein K8I00_08995, partial [Candidatus Omnitrophica bacterium]|nr:hypothetical protein [Candidatus Omnitrophota bacterium]